MKLMTSKGKKLFVLVFALVLTTAIIGTVAFASQSLDSVKKDVLISEEDTFTGGENIKVDATSTPVNSSIDEKQALDIGKNSLNSVFKTDIDELNLKSSGSFVNDAVELENMGFKNPYWNIIFSPAELNDWKNYRAKLSSASKEDLEKEIAKNEISKTSTYIFASAKIDSKTGEILALSYQSGCDYTKPDTVSAKESKQIALDFIQDNNLNSEAKILKATAYAYPYKKAVFVEVELENGIKAQVLINTILGKAVYYISNVPESQWSAIEEAVKNIEKN